MGWNKKAAVGEGEGIKESISIILIIIIVILMVAFFLYKIISLKNLAPP